MPEPAPATAPPVSDNASPWDDALWAIDALRLDAPGLGGVRLRAGHGPVRERWLQRLREHAPSLWRVPIHSDDAALLGGLDLGATLDSGQLRWHTGLLARAESGWLLLPMAERAPHALLARLSQALDRHCVSQADGRESACARTVVALDEADDDEAGLHPKLGERLGLWLDLRAVALSHSAGPAAGRSEAELQRARHCLQRLPDDPATLGVLSQVAAHLGVHDARALLWAWRCAQVSAALREAAQIAPDDVLRAVRCVLLPRARVCPPAPPTDAPTPPPPSDTPTDAADPPPESEPGSADVPDDQLLAATLASLPTELLDQLATRSMPSRRSASSQGHSGQSQRSLQRGRPLPARAGKPNDRARLDVLATLRHAAPLQRIRAPQGHGDRLRLRSEDFHTRRYAHKSASCLILALDASGSAAMQRLAQAKGAVELLLARSYARRDSVCVIGFRGARAECLLAPTRSLVRAKRALAGLPGGGGTPLASALELSLAQAQRLHREGQTPLLVVLSDGRANVTLAGLGGRQQAHEQALAVSRRWAETGFASLWIDTAMQPEAQAQALAAQMQARYLPMPHVQAQRLADAMRHSG